MTSLRHAHTARPPAIAGEYGIAVVGGAPGSRVVLTLGTWKTGPAWSTIKVPLVEAVLRSTGGTATTADMRQALTVSDNAAASRLWQTLGSGTKAAGRVDAVLAAHENQNVRTQPFVTRAGFSAEGQTQWTLGDQATFAAALPCAHDPADGPVLDLLGHIDPSQQWGAGRWPGARFKGGWGPSPTGAYVARQLALLPHAGGWTAVALAAVARDGSFVSATQALDDLERWLATHTAELPLASCDKQ
ncbi:hypothetical protein ABEG17_08455 [Pedococcus sp. KACC 23699]|uniref:Serine hydrolase n=1 Tax=Pedococcus sp. KACC 23699 TaxID=3149228 RepID=A0AAU7JY37_9MICO